MVGGLVEEEHVGAAEEHLREQHAQLEAAGERRERLPVRRDRDAEALEDRARARLERVAVVRADAVLELDEARGVGRVARALGDERVLLGERARDDLVAGHRDVEDHVLVAHEAILPEHADARALGDDDRALGGGLVAGDDLEERRLAGAVGADEAVARPANELERHALEERARAVRLAEVLDRDHETRGGATRDATARVASMVSPAIAT